MEFCVQTRLAEGRLSRAGCGQEKTVEDIDVFVEECGLRIPEGASAVKIAGLYVCPECGDTTRTIKGWRSHNLSVHGERADTDLWAEIYGDGTRCEACDKEFST